MAGLTLKDLRKGRVSTFVMKMEEGVKTSKPEYMFTKIDGRKLILRTMQYNPGGRIVFYEIVKHKKVILDLLSGSSTLPNLKFTDITGNETVTLAEILKTEEFGGRAHRGDMAELIYSAAIAARFYHRGSKPISKTEVNWVLNHMNDTNTNQRHGPWKSENDQRGVYDEIYWSFSAPIITVKTLSKPANRKSKDIDNLINSSIEWVNSEKIKRKVASTGKNNKSNKIIISAVGSSAQTESNIDINVTVDGKLIKLSSGEVQKQSPFTGGGGYQKQLELWMYLLSLEVPRSSIESYSKRLHSGIPQAMFQIYFDMSKIIQRKLADINNPIYSDLSTGIQYIQSKRDPVIEMAVMPTTMIKLLNNDGIRTALRITNKKLSCSAAMVSGVPTLIIKEASKGIPLLTIRFKKIPGVDLYKNVIERGPAFDQIARVLK